jgi:hypothetical protein
MRIILLAALYALAACGSGAAERERGIRLMERELAKRAERRLGVGVTKVVCPRDVDLDDGVRVTCFAHLAGGEEKVELSVRWHSDRARASMRLPRRWRLSAELRKQLETKYHTRVRGVICPKEITSKKGVMVACAARVEGGEVPVTIEITFTNDQGGYMWQDKGVVLVRKVETVVGEALEKRGKPGKVTCAGAVRSSQPGTIFRCPIAYQSGGKGEVTVRLKSWQGDIGFEVE